MNDRYSKDSEKRMTTNYSFLVQTYVCSFSFGLLFIFFIICLGLEIVGSESKEQL